MEATTRGLYFKWTREEIRGKKGIHRGIGPDCLMVITATNTAVAILGGAAAMV